MTNKLLPEIIRFSEKYKPLFQQDILCRYAIVTGGRGSGKSYALSTWQGVDCNSRSKAENTLYLRKTLTSAHLSIIPEFWEKIELLGIASNFQPTKTEIIHRKSGSQIFFRGIQSSSRNNEANLKSVHNVTTVIIDEAQEVEEDEFDRIDLSVRAVGSRNRVILSLNPTEDEDHWIHRRFFKDVNLPDDFNGILGDTIYIHTDYQDNLENLSEDFIAVAEKTKKTNLAKYRNQFLGFWGGEKPESLWKRLTMIDPYRVGNIDPSELDRIIVAVDPAVTSAASSDETGIVVAGVKYGGRNADNHYYVLDDESMRGTPNEWAERIVELYYGYEADRIVAEVNNGGDMIEALIRDKDRSVAFQAVRATRGKILRAEPIAALYERGLVHHAGHFAILEEQMCNYTGGVAEKSPDRLDALVWALTQLSGNNPGHIGGGADLALTY